MKAFKILSCFVIILCVISGGCKSSQKSAIVQKEKNAVEIVLPFTGPEYSSNNEYFRARQSGTSPDLPTAKKIAVQNAKADVAASIQTIVMRTTDQYTAQRTIGNKQEFKSKFEELSQEVADQQLIGAATLAEKVVKGKDGIYTYWVVIEVPRQSFLDGLNKAINSNRNLQKDFEKQQYEKTFNEEMKKLENENKK